MFRARLWALPLCLDCSQESIFGASGADLSSGQGKRPKALAQRSTCDARTPAARAADLLTLSLRLQKAQPPTPTETETPLRERERERQTELKSMAGTRHSWCSNGPPGLFLPAILTSRAERQMRAERAEQSRAPAASPRALAAATGNPERPSLDTSSRLRAALHAAAPS